MSLVTTMLSSVQNSSESFTTLTVTGVSTFGNLQISGNTISSTNAGGDIVLTPTTTGVVEVGANSTHASTLRWKEDTDNGLNYITLSAPASLATDTAYEWPAAAPGTSGFSLRCTTAGVWSWQSPSLEITVDQTTTPVNMVANIVYIANSGSSITFNLPATAAVGDIFEIVGFGAGGWVLQANTGQVVHNAASPTSSGGTLTTTDRYDCIKIRCVVANTTFVKVRISGTLTAA